VIKNKPKANKEIIIPILAYYTSTELQSFQ
jgi:hypothetical protein